MPTLDDLPTLSQAVPTGDDLFAVYDPTATGSSKVRKMSFNQLGGLSADSVTTGGTSALQTAVVAPILTGTAVTGWTITNGGLYASAPTVTLSGTGTATFLATLTDGVVTSISTTPASGTNSFSGSPTVVVTASTFYEEVKTRLVYGVAATTQLTFPPVAGPLRNFTVIKNGAGACTVTRHPANTGNIILSAAAAPATTATVATATAVTFVSDGTNWYRTV